MKRIIFSILICCFTLQSDSLFAQNQPDRSNHGNKFEQIDSWLPSPNRYRNIDGNQGPDYWQQKADYTIDCTLDTKEHRLDGKETITYHNNSPTALSYLWLQLDENEHSPEADKHYMEPSSIKSHMSKDDLERLSYVESLDKYGHKIQSVTDANGRALDYTINKTMMRINLPEALKSGESVSFNIDWHYYLIDRINSKSWGRGGYEYFEDDGNYLYTIVQWFPRMCSYTDNQGWQNNQFTGRGEFALTFGDYDVKMTLPDDFVVGSTGECQNYDRVLTGTQKQRWEAAKTSTEPVEIVTLDEAKAMEQQSPSNRTTTWHYKAENVRDFAWTASRKFIWDAMPHINELGDRVMCMSYYAKEAYPIYSKYSTKATEHTLDVYSRYSIPYPYPVAISVEAANGMEYPMICFNPGRAEKDGTYTERAKYAALTVIIHEVGHNYYPMIINSDERQWAWFDEGLNSFVQFIAEAEFDSNYNHWFVAPMGIADYMASPKDKLEPIMTNTENIINYGSNAYDKPAAALNILRETIMGRELFDHAFKEFGKRWAFKHPTPADFFRTMEDASGIDLDWFWRGWFYSIDAVDISLDSVDYFIADLENDPETQERSFERKLTQPFNHISRRKNIEEGVEFLVDQDETLKDFYNSYRPWETEDSISSTTLINFNEHFTKEEKEANFSDKHYYQLHFTNKGGLVMPVILEWQYEDGTTEVQKIPVEIWRKNEGGFSKSFVKNKKVEHIVVDPFFETADIDTDNNTMSPPSTPGQFQVFKSHKVKDKLNPMQMAKKREQDKKKGIKP